MFRPESYESSIEKVQLEFSTCNLRGSAHLWSIGRDPAEFHVEMTLVRFKKNKFLKLNPKKIFRCLFAIMHIHGVPFFARSEVAAHHVYKEDAVSVHSWRELLPICTVKEQQRRIRGGCIPRSFET